MKTMDQLIKQELENLEAINIMYNGVEAMFAKINSDNDEF